MSDVRGRGRGMALGQSKMQEMSAANDAIANFQNAKKIDEKARAGQQIQTLLSGDGGDPEVRQMLQEFSTSMKVNQWMRAYKAMKDLDELGSHSFEYGSSGNEEHLQAMKDMSEDLTRDPMARALAGDFAKYQEHYTNFSETVNEFGRDSELTHRVDEDYTIHHKKNEKDVVMRGDVVIMKVNSSDDPRMLHMVVKNMESMLMPDSTGKKDMITGRTIQDSRSSLSHVMTEAQEYLIDRVKEVDAPRMNRSLQMGTQELERMQREKEEYSRQQKLKKEQKKEEPKKKRGLGLFK